jgi:hypothetical protein
MYSSSYRTRNNSDIVCLNPHNCRYSIYIDIGRWFSLVLRFFNYNSAAATLFHCCCTWRLPVFNTWVFDHKTCVLPLQNRPIRLFYILNTLLWLAIFRIWVPKRTRKSLWRQVMINYSLRNADRTLTRMSLLNWFCI